MLETGRPDAAVVKWLPQLLIGYLSEENLVHLVSPYASALFPQASWIFVLYMLYTSHRLPRVSPLSRHPST